MTRNLNTAIRTYSGRTFWPMQPQEEDIHLLDIAHALANTCRFGGHTNVHYSVAQHSCLVSGLIERATGDITAALIGLLHDGSEAYLVDVPRPVKMAPGMEVYREAEHRLQAMVYRRFGIAFDVGDPDWLTEADRLMCDAEIRDLMVCTEASAASAARTQHIPTIVPVTPAEAEVQFHRLYDRLSTYARPNIGVLQPLR